MKIRSDFVCTLLLTAGLAACGGDASLHEDPQAVFARSMRCVSEGDWPGLQPLLTPRAGAALGRALDGLESRLATRGGFAHERRLARERLGPNAESAIEAARGGDEGALLLFVAQVSGLDARPKAERRDLGPSEVEFLYADGRGVRRAVRLVRIDGKWYVDDLQL